MNVEELRSVQRTERQKDSLQHLRDSFYRDVAEYVAERKAERERVAAEADDPFSSPEVTRLTDEIETAEEVVESIYERRIGKIVKRATFAAAGMAAEDEGLTSEERDLFDDLVARIERNRETVLDTLAGEIGDDEGTAADTPTPDETGRVDPEPAPDPEPTLPTESEAGASDEVPGRAPAPDDLLAEAMGGDASSVEAADTSPSTETPVPPDESPTPDGGDAVASPTGGSGTDPDTTPDTETDRTTLRITRDVGEIFGVDEREYDLASEDVVTLPTPNAEPLLERDAAERLE
ncbi:hypothetical protein [Haloplanus aerogenes]|uniref:DNA replication factor GINS n=1 Tax=Haloplanus aerogenes TaxID=660522 RepID=A0A3M0DFK0_9EURY|nr:hypothetical protein [Haloplanus aerogenes]AZH26376.1 hypothetical protein DU502_13825 [Haloplanus aerogenes]RMB18159.1 DNA replication factor GINS [Haloplanus aerogenes]